jgi:predicted nucleic acid-binding protein
VRRVTLDTNVLVSALMYRRGKPFQLLRMALEGEIGVMISAAIRMGLEESGGQTPGNAAYGSSSPPPFA